MKTLTIGILVGISALVGLMLGTLWIAESAQAATPPQTIPQGGTGWGAFSLGNIPIGPGTSLPGSLRFATSSGFTFATSTKTLSATYASTTAVSGTSVCIGADCRTVWPSATGSGLATSSPISAGDVLTYSSSGAGSAFGTATGTLSGTANQISISATAAVLLAPATLSFPNRLIFPLSFESTYGTTTFASSTALTATNLFSTNATSSHLAATSETTGCAKFLADGALVSTGSNCNAGTLTSITAGLGLNGGTITTSGTIDLKSYVATSSAETANQIAYWTSTAGTPANLSGGFSGFTTNGVKVTTNFASSTAITASGALYIPNSSSQAPTVTGQLAQDTTDNQLVLGTGGGTAVFDQRRFYSFGEVGTTTGNVITGSTTMSGAPFAVAGTITQVECTTDIGTVDVKWQYGPTPTQAVYIHAASTTPGIYVLSSNNTPAANASSTITIGTPVSSPTTVSCTGTLTITGT